MKIGLAFRAFFAALFRPEAASDLAAALAPKDSATKNLTDAKPSSSETAKSAVKPTPAPVTPQASSNRSDALTLLSALQREARLLDLIQEPLGNYSDAQVGAAAREVLQDTSKVIQRMFALKPLSDADEGSRIELPPDASPARYKRIGKAETNSSVTLVHPGWIATASNVPTWTGDAKDKFVLMPAEVE